MIGEVVAPDGRVPESDIRRLAEFGRSLRRRFAHPVGDTRGTGGELELALPGPRKVDQVVLMEDIAQGERVREYQVRGLVAGGGWRELAAGQSIGHKWIHRFEPVETTRLKLTVSRSTAQPLIRRFAAFAPNAAESS